MVAPEIDCQECGACCGDQVIPLLPKDRVPIHMRDGMFLHMGGQQCSALLGRIGHKVSCSIYKSRPTVCAAFAKGSKGCLELRASRYLK